MTGLVMWALYLFAPPRPRVFTWPLDHLRTRAQPVGLSPTARASTTAEHRTPPPADAPRRCTVLTAHGTEEWNLR